MTKTKAKSKGQILLLTVITIGTISVLGVLLNTLLVRNNNFANIRFHQENAEELAEAGIEYVRWDMNENQNFAGGTLNLPDGDVVMTVNQVSGTLVSLQAVGYSPSQANAEATRTIFADAFIDTTDIAFNYGVQVGAGGVTMDNNSQISGNLYSNGTISGNGTITGTTQVATGAVLDSSWEVQSGGIDGEYRFGYALNELDAAQSFSPTITETITRVGLLLKKKCRNPAQCPPNLTLRILADNAGEPDKNSVIATGTLSQSLFTESGFGWADVPIDTPAQLTSGTTYWMVLATSDTYPAGNTDRYWYWAKDKNQGYGNGVSKYSADWNAVSPTWTTIVGDLNFRIYIGAQTTFIDGITIQENAYAYEIKNAAISDEAFYTLIDAGSTVNGSACPNASCNPGTAAPALQVLPLSDANITDFKNEAIAGGTTVGDVLIDGSNMTIGPQEITGNLTLNNNAQLKVSGTLYVHGTILVDNNSLIYLDSSYGSTSGTLVSDGVITSQNNTKFCGSGWNGTTCDSSNGSYVMLLTTNNKQTVADPAIAVHNNTAAVIFYAQNGAITLYNNAGLYEAVAHTLHLEENAVVTYESGLANTNFSSGPGASWQIKPGTWREVS